MNKVNAVLLGIVLLLSIAGIGCDPQVAAASSGIEVVSVKLEDWTNPEDGKVYVVAMPTWKNNGKAAVRQVTFTAAIKGDESVQPSNQSDEPQFHGAAIEPGTTIEPDQVPDEGVILGEKEALKNLKPEAVEILAIASEKDYVPDQKSKV